MQTLLAKIKIAEYCNLLAAFYNFKWLALPTQIMLFSNESAKLPIILIPKLMGIMCKTNFSLLTRHSLFIQRKSGLKFWKMIRH